MKELPPAPVERLPTRDAQHVAEWIAESQHLLLGREDLLQSALRPLLQLHPERANETQAAVLAIRQRLDEIYQRTAAVSGDTWRDGQRLLLTGGADKGIEDPVN